MHTLKAKSLIFSLFAPLLSRTKIIVRRRNVFYYYYYFILRFYGCVRSVFPSSSSSPRAQIRRSRKRIGGSQRNDLCSWSWLFGWWGRATGNVVSGERMIVGRGVAGASRRRGRGDDEGGPAAYKNRHYEFNRWRQDYGQSARLRHTRADQISICSDSCPLSLYVCVCVCFFWHILFVDFGAARKNVKYDE